MEFHQHLHPQIHQLMVIIRTSRLLMLVVLLTDPMGLMDLLWGCVSLGFCCCYLGYFLPFWSSFVRGNRKSLLIMDQKVSLELHLVGLKVDCAFANLHCSVCSLIGLHLHAKLSWLFSH